MVSHDGCAPFLFASQPSQKPSSLSTAISCQGSVPAIKKRQVDSRMIPTIFHQRLEKVRRLQETNRFFDGGHCHQSIISGVLTNRFFCRQANSEIHVYEGRKLQKFGCGMDI